MIAVWRCLHADWYKVKRTPFVWMHVGLPLIWTIVYVLYMQGRTYTMVNVYTGYMEVLGAMLPLLSGIICGMVAMQEEQAGHFQNVLTRTRIKETGYASKLLLVWGCGSLSIILSVLLLGCGISLSLDIGQVPYATFLLGAVYLLLTSAILYVIQLWVSFTFGIGASILLGGSGTLIAAIMITGLGDHIWHYIPWAWGVRMTDSIALLHMDTLTEAVQSYLKQDMATGWLWVIAVSIVTLLGSLLWFRHWEGSRTYE
ncbi:lantibiotic immunity ABC transporter MutG family permease subunit [Paenibacillus sp. WLX2291]|uniref:lantibiotic immunity ABC transporter MutG family permease subunit n=1 Tax=Paenibacillus sp. WLX2291 TaxID=3296934 RepID=UPI00398438BA